ncbi:MAG: hypothetical protein BWK77_01415 [Verrucomicrobia bacterium A1]|nr:MAG: hypothetical protein BWK77_01415 [Verrucomicrobia bacterium A1]
MPKEIEGFYGMIENIDDNIGRLRAALATQGIERETLFIFMTDNGSAAGSKIYNAGMRGAKGSPWNGGSRVPFFLLRHGPSGTCLRTSAVGRAATIRASTRWPTAVCGRATGRWCRKRRGPRRAHPPARPALRAGSSST